VYPTTPTLSLDALHLIVADPKESDVRARFAGADGGVVSFDPVDGQAAVLIDADARGETLPFVSDASTPIV
jgi:hypothetical protein